jgi:hypothetical protein
MQPAENSGSIEHRAAHQEANGDDRRRIPQGLDRLHRPREPAQKAVLRLVQSEPHAHLDPNNWFTGVEYRYSQYEAQSFVYPIPILNLGFVGFKQELSNNQVPARIGYKF